MELARQLVTAAVLLGCQLMPGGMRRVAAGDTAPTVLLDFTSGFDVSRVHTSDATVEVTAEGGLAVRTGADKDYPGVTLRAPTGKWDLSGSLQVASDVTNRAAEAVTVFCRVDNPGADGSKNCLTGSVRIEAGATRTLTVALSPTPWRLSKAVDLVGMRAAPGKSGQLDPANVTQLLFFLMKPRARHSFEIGKVLATGRAIEIDADKFFPFIDEMGQFIHVDWPGKTRSTEDLKTSGESEEKDLAEHPGPSRWNQYGGWAGGPRLEATGFFRVAKHEGKWWLVDPEGRLFWSHGVDCVRMSNATPITDRERYFRWLPPDNSPFARFYGRGNWAPHGYYQGRGPYRTFDFGRANLFRKHGDEWEKASAELSHRRLRSWGMNTIANWSERSVYELRKTPYTATIGFSSRPIEGSEGYWGKFPDPFDPSFRDALKKAVDREKGGAAGDPWCLGFFVHNELGWGDEVSLAIGALASPPDQPAKKAFVEDLKARYGPIEKLNESWATRHASWEALLESREPPDRGKAAADLARFYTRVAETYFRTIREELKSVAPNQLYLGCRFAWGNERASRAAAQYCDVVSYNRYSYTVEDLRLPEGVDVPAIIGEFHFGALDRGMFHTGLCPTDSQEDRAAKYQSYVEGALRNPCLVGTHWFQYQDQATTGRGDGENYQIGLVDICDRPYPETISALRGVGRGIYEYRSEGVIFGDSFRTVPGAPWSWIRENPANHRLDCGLSIRLEPGGLMGAAKDAHNILVRPLLAGARSVSVGVETNHASQFEQAGLILYRDDDNYVKWVREYVDGATWIVLVAEVEARPSVVAKAPLPQGKTWIAFDFADRGVAALCWGDTREPVKVGDVEFSMQPAPRIGVFTQSGQAGADRWARFTDFWVRSQPCTAIPRVPRPGATGS